MAGKGKTNTHRLRFGSTVLYYLTIVLLIISIVFMYDKWKDRQKQYDQLVQEAALQDQAYAIELQKTRDDQEEAVEDKTETPDTRQ